MTSIHAWLLGRCDDVVSPVASGPTRCRRSARRLSLVAAHLLILGGLLALPAFSQEQASGPARGAAAPGAGEDPAVLAGREQELLAQYRELEKTFLRLADLLAASDPRRAAVLRSVFEQARDQEVGGRLDTIVQLLEKGQLLKAGTTQASAIEQLRELLTLLEAGDSDRHLTNSKEEVKQFLARVSKLIAKQRDIEGSTEAGSREAQLLDRQNALATETSDLSRDLGGFAKRMEVRDAGGEPLKEGKEAKEGQGDEPAKGDKPGGKEGDAEASPDGKPDGKQPEGGAKDPSPKADAPKPGAEGEPQQGEGTPKGEAKPESGEGEKGGSTKPSPGGEPAEGQGSGESGEDGNQPEPPPDGDDESSRAKRTQNRLEAAAERMKKAEEEIEKAKRRNARQEQEKAIEELETARAELEEILRQMREQEVERLLVQLETRLRAMLRAEKAVLAAAERIAAEPTADRERERELLGRGDVGGTTRGIIQDIVASLEEMVAALEKAQRDQQQQQKGAAGGRPAEPGEQPLVDKLSELKMIRSLQMRVNTRTRRFSQVLGEGAEQAEEPELLDAVRRLSDRQRKIERAAHDIVSGLTE